MLLPLYNRGQDLVRMCTNNNSFNSYWYKHIYRENNRTADENMQGMLLSLNKVVLGITTEYQFYTKVSFVCRKQNGSI